MCYSSGCVIVIEYLNDKTQQHLTGHHTEISTIVLSNGGCGLASASHTHKQWKCEIRIWQLDSNKCIKVSDNKSTTCFGCGFITVIIIILCADSAG